MALWYVKTWLTAEQIKRRLAILFSERDEVVIQEAGRDTACLGQINGGISWLPGRLEDEEPVDPAPPIGPRAAWAAFQSLVEDLARPLSAIAHGDQVRKFASSLRPSVWLFSGWNCVPAMLPSAIMAVTGPP